MVEIRTVRLEPMRVACLQTFSTSPEEDGLRKLRAWADSQGLLDNSTEHRIFGFDLPTLADGPERAYDFWSRVGPDVEGGGAITINEFAGGLYAVLRCAVDGDPWRIIPSPWQQLANWCARSDYHLASHQCLEEHLETTSWPQAFTLDLYLPIAE